MLKYLTLEIFLLALSGCAGNIKGEPGIAVNGQKPAYEQTAPGTSQIVVPAAAAKPAKIVIAGTLYTNSKDIICDVKTTTGRNGLDVGSLQPGKMLYLYAIPGSTGSNFDLVASLNSPLSGPTGFPNWSYIGAFAVDTNKTVLAFHIINGNLIYDDSHLLTSTTTISSGFIEVDPNLESILQNNYEVIPSTITGIYLNPSASSIPSVTKAVNRGSFHFSINGTNIYAEVASWPEIAVGDALDAWGDLWMPLSKDRTFFYWVNGPGTSETQLTIRIYILGFSEDANLWP